MHTVPISVSHPYEVKIGPGLIDRCGDEIAALFPNRTAAIVTETTVNALYGDRVEDRLRTAGLPTLRTAFPAGEIHKRLSTLESILEFLAENGLTRGDLIVALGGGVPGDVAGFAAAVYARGIAFVQIPTTLLAAVDASVGGKTAVDLRAGKNMAGCFHQPSLVLTDTDVLRALPKALLSDGAAEVIKCGVLADEKLFETLCREDWPEKMDAIVARCVEIKRDVVIADEYDNGVRQLLNLGHTFGHAIEKRSNFSISHGQAVAMGTAIAAGAAGREDVCRAVLRANRACGLPLRAPYAPEELYEAALSDKKRRGGNITVVLPERIGACALKTVPVGELLTLFKKGMAMVEALS